MNDMGRGQKSEKPGDLPDSFDCFREMELNQIEVHKKNLTPNSLVTLSLNSSFSIDSKVF